MSEGAVEVAGGKVESVPEVIVDVTVEEIRDVYLMALCGMKRGFAPSPKMARSYKAVRGWLQKLGMVA